MSRAEERNAGARRRRSPARTSRWEWAVGIVGALLFVALLAYLGARALSADERPPDVAVRTLSVQRVTDGWVVEFEARNRGGQTAADVRITATLHPAGGDPEEQEATLDYLPANSVRRGGLFFSSDPGSGRLDLRASGYAEP